MTTNEIEDNFEQLLDIQIQRGDIVAWAIVNDRQPKSKILFKILGTGWDFEGDPGIYLKTVQDDLGYVWHIFAVPQHDAVLQAAYMS